MKAAYEKPMVNLILNGDSLQSACQLLPIPVNVVLEVLARATKARKQNKIQISGNMIYM